MYTILKLFHLTILLLISTIVTAQTNVIYQVAYPDSQIVEVPGGWKLEKEPETVMETTSNVMLNEIKNSAFPTASIAVDHVGKTFYYAINDGVTSWLGFSELSQNYVFKSAKFTSFYDYEVTDSLEGNFGKFSYYKKSKPLKTGAFQIGMKNYKNIQNVETIEIFKEFTPDSLLKIRKCNSFYINNSQLPLLEYVYDTLITENSKRIIEFVIYNSDLTLKIEKQKEDSFLVFPNPFNSGFNLHNSSGKNGIARIMSISGEELFLQNIISPNTRIETPGLASGIYILEFRTDKTAQSIKLVKK